MKLFLDSADLEEIRGAAAYGPVDGVTMNAGLLSRQKLPLDELLPEICALVPGPVCAPVRATDPEAMVIEARALAKLHDSVVVKIPVRSEWLWAMLKLRSEGIRTHATMCYTANQAMLAARSGAHFVSPFVGRVDDMGSSGMELVSNIIEIYDNYEFDTEILVASVRSATVVQESALLGTDGCTVPFAVFKELGWHPLSAAPARTGRGRKKRED